MCLLDNPSRRGTVCCVLREREEKERGEKEKEREEKEGERERRENRECETKG